MVYYSVLLTSVLKRVVKFLGLEMETVNGTLYDGSSKHGKSRLALFGLMRVAKKLLEY